jgi:hypothetical protein
VTPRRALLATTLALAGAGAGCTVGSGAGSAVGPLYVVGCNTRNGPLSLGTFDTPACFNLNPSFFAANPTEEFSGSQLPSNRLTIRMQTDGNAVTGAYMNFVYGSDAFYIEVLNSFQVARCLRGRCNADGTPDWDTRNVADLTGGFTDQVWCDWGPNPCAGGVTAAGAAGGGVPDGGPPADAGVFADGGGALGTGPPFVPSAQTVMCSAQAIERPLTRPLIHFGPLEYVTAALTPIGTCPTARLTGTAVDGWIDFIEFGQATTAGSIGSDFKVNFGEKLQASFHAILQDDRVVTEINTLQMRMPPQIGGALDGFFDFTFERGRAAQPFP